MTQCNAKDKYKSSTDMYCSSTNVKKQKKNSKDEKIVSFDNNVKYDIVKTIDNLFST